MSSVCDLVELNAMNRRNNPAPVLLVPVLLLAAVTSSVGCADSAGDAAETTLNAAPREAIASPTEPEPVPSDGTGGPADEVKGPAAAAPPGCAGDIYHFLLVDSTGPNPYTFDGYPRPDGIQSSHHALGPPAEVDPAFGPNWSGQLPPEIVSEGRRLLALGITARPREPADPSHHDARGRGHGRRPAPDGLTLSYRAADGNCQVTGDASEAWLDLARRVRALGRAQAPTGSGDGAGAGPATTAPAALGSNFFSAESAPDPLACQRDANCIASGTVDSGGCCYTYRDMNAVAMSNAYRTWLQGHRSAHCGGVDCGGIPAPSRPPSCLFQLSCVEGRCQNACP